MITTHVRSRMPRSRQLIAIFLAVVFGSGAALSGLPSAAPAPVEAAEPHVASAFEFREPPAVPCLEPTINGFLAMFYAKGDCLRMRFALSDTPVSAGKAANVELIGPAGGAPFATIAAVQEGDDDWMMLHSVDAAWPSGRIAARVKVSGAERQRGSDPGLRQPAGGHRLRR